MATVVSECAWHGAIANISDQHGRYILLRGDIIHNRGKTSSWSAKATATKYWANKWPDLAHCRLSSRTLSDWRTAIIHDLAREMLPAEPSFR
jgi:hypothetical protein